MFFEDVRYVYENESDGIVGYGTSQLSYDLSIKDWQDQVNFQVLQTIKAPR